MMNADFETAFTIGRNAASDRLLRDDVSRDDPRWTCWDLDDRVYPNAFANALDVLEHCEAQEIGDAVHAGISDAWETCA